jgi:hypothetical protein
MDLVMRPMLIALAATVALGAVWLVALGHKSGEIAGTPAAPVQAIAKARKASAASDAANAKVRAAGGADKTGARAAAPAASTTAAASAASSKAASAKAVAANATSAKAASAKTTSAKAASAKATAAKAASAKTASAKPAASAKAAPTKAAAPHGSAASTRDAAVVRDLRSGKVVVMLFWNANAADDVATRDAVRNLNRHGGKVAVHIVPISRVGEYESITQGVTINQSPTTLVIDRKRRTRPITGLTEPGELTQAVDDALAGRH